jgi:hypothetical protein
MPPTEPLTPNPAAGERSLAEDRLCAAVAILNRKKYLGWSDWYWWADRGRATTREGYPASYYPAFETIAIAEKLDPAFREAAGAGRANTSLPVVRWQEKGDYVFARVSEEYSVELFDSDGKKGWFGFGKYYHGDDFASFQVPYQPTLDAAKSYATRRLGLLLAALGTSGEE